MLQIIKNKCVATKICYVFTILENVFILSGNCEKDECVLCTCAWECMLAKSKFDLRISWSSPKKWFGPIRLTDPYIDRQEEDNNRKYFIHDLRALQRQWTPGQSCLMSDRGISPNLSVLVITFSDEITPSHKTRSKGNESHYLASDKSAIAFGFLILVACRYAVVVHKRKNRSDGINSRDSLAHLIAFLI
jgi:hypothetical protein